MIVHRFDADGYFLENVEIGINEEIPEDCTPVPLPQPCWKSQFDKQTQKWKETATEEEKGTNYPQVPSSDERLEMLEAALIELMISGGNG